MKYTYKDANSGTEYCTHTDTSGPSVKYKSMEDLRYTVHEGGDHTQCHKKVLSIGALGSSRI
jgi:hypothetical protein